MKTSRLLCLLLLALALNLPCEAGLKVYYIRHAQSGSNAKKEWKDTPADQRPAYVGNPDSFSPLGEKQAAAVPGELAPYHFDFIAVSPKWRTRHTILPYLEARKLKGELWPELEEFGPGDGDPALIGKAGLPAPAADFLTGGTRIVLPADEQAYFTFRKDARTDPKFTRDKSAQGASNLTFMIQQAIARLRQEFGGTEKSILLVGHANAGRHFMQLLTGDYDTTKTSMKNTGLWMAEQQPDGSFKIMIANNEPVAHAAAAPVPKS